MWTSAHIKRHIANLKPGDIFTTRDLLLYGTRKAVDQAIYILVEGGRIERLARGVFMKPAVTKRVVTVWEIAQVKAKAFGKRIVSHGIDAAKKAGLQEEGNAEPTYLVDGSSSSFRFGNVVIHFKRGSKRKMILGEDRVGVAIRALWSMGRKGLSGKSVMIATEGFKRGERRKFHYVKDLMPWWLSDFLYTGGDERKGGYWANFWRGRAIYVRGYSRLNPDLGLA